MRMLTLIAVLTLGSAAYGQQKICINGRCYDRMPTDTGSTFAWPQTVEPPRYVPRYTPPVAVQSPRSTVCNCASCNCINCNCGVSSPVVTYYRREPNVIEYRAIQPRVIYYVR